MSEPLTLDGSLHSPGSNVEEPSKRASIETNHWFPLRCKGRILFKRKRAAKR